MHTDPSHCKLTGAPYDATVVLNLSSNVKANPTNWRPSFFS